MTNLSLILALIPLLLVTTQIAFAQTTNPEFNCIYKAAYNAVTRGVEIGHISSSNSTLENVSETAVINEATHEISDCVEAAK